MSDEAQALLLCLAPFTGVFNRGWLEQYTTHLKVQPALAGLPYERWLEVLQEAANWGLLQPHEQLGQAGYLRLQPIFPYFLKSRLNDESRAASKNAIEEAYREHYDDIGDKLSQYIQSNEAQERQIGQLLIEVEYENLMTALQLALTSTTLFSQFYNALDLFTRSRRDYLQQLHLARQVVGFRSRYLSQGNSFVVDFAVVWLRLGNSHLLLKQYKDAENAYQNALELLNSAGDQSDLNVVSNRASTLHQLGGVAEEQRQWVAAE